MPRTILIVDDEQEIRQSLSGALTDEGYRVFAVGDGASALSAALQYSPDVILLDVWLSSAHEGLDILTKLRQQNPEQAVIIMSGHGTIETAVKATKLGAYDFLEKPLSLDKVLLTVQNALQLRDLSRENESLRARLQRSKVLIGQTPAMKTLLQQLRRASATNAWVLITGENGTGKELVAHMVHALSPRFDLPFIEVNCAAIPEELIESELFGHEKGSFTGANQLKRGRFEAAHGGTLFLDEIGDMSLKTQAKILRILQEQRFERVGGNQTIEVDVRVVAATNKDLELEIKRGTFREDLFHRLNVIRFRVPALRERIDDLPLLAQYFLAEFSLPGQAHRKLTDDAISLMKSYSWPGNVRELKNTIERLLILSESTTLDANELRQFTPALETISETGQVSDISPVNPDAIKPSKPSLLTSKSNLSSLSALSLKDAKNEFEKELIVRTLSENDWNVSKTAQILGIERTHLHRKIKALGIEGSAGTEVE